MGVSLSSIDLPNLVVTTRRARPEDVKPIEALETRAFATDRLSARSLRDYLKSPSATVLSVPPSTTSGNRSGHSHTPPVACAGPKCEAKVHCSRSGEV